MSGNYIQENPDCPPPQQPQGACEQSLTPGRWLEQWAPAKRSLIGSLFFHAVRMGATTVPDVIISVQQDLRRRLGTVPPGWDTSVLHNVWESLQNQPHTAYLYAQSVIDREGLPSSQRQQEKTVRAKSYMLEAMKNKPPSEKQLAYLKRLGYAGQAPSDRGVAAELIDSLLQRHREVAS